MGGNFTTPEERERITALLHEGKSFYKIAKEVGRHRNTIKLIADKLGIERESAKTERGAQARRDYAQIERLELLNKGFDKAAELLPNIQDAAELQKWMIAVATGIDKRRLEDGEATSRNEAIDPERRRKMKAALDELAERRGA